jgi:hypothetical protein
VKGHMRIAFFGAYALINLAIILFAISLWFRGMPSEAIFVGLWAPTLDLLYVMAMLTFSPWAMRGLSAERRRELHTVDDQAA